MKILMLSADAQMIDRRIIQEARTLTQAGHSLTVLSGFECQTPDAYVDDVGVTVKRYRYPWSDLRREQFIQASYGRWARRIRKLLWPFRRLCYRLSNGPNAFEAFVLSKALEHKFDVVHIHDFPMLRVGVMAAKLRGVPAIYDSHEFYPIQSEFPPQVQKRYLRIEGTYARQCAAVITVNPYIARMIADAHAIPLPDVILNASVLTEVQPRALREELGWAKTDIIVVYQGWISAERNLEVLIEAMVGLPPHVKLLVIGYGDHLSVLKALAEQLNVQDNIAFYGRVESDDLPAFTAACDIGVIPYAAVDEMHRYCSPNKLFEFIAARLPIIANDLPYLRDVVAGYGAGVLTDLTSAEALRKAIVDLVSDQDKMQRARTAASTARAELNWDTEGQKLLGIYARLFPAASSDTPPRPASPSL